MAVKVRIADLHLDRGIIIDVLGRFIGSLSDDRRFEWLYAQNPQGQARAWLVVDEANNSIVGTAAAFSRRFYAGGREIMSWVLADFYLDPQYRSVGPALKLLRACLSMLATDRYAFCYDFPDSRMLAVYRRLGFNLTGQMPRLVMPLRVDRKEGEMIKDPSAQRVVAAAGNTPLEIASPRADADESFEISLHPQLCGEEFTALAQEQSGKFGICLQRFAEYLNWRYLNNPVTHHEIVTARRDGRLVGYAVWTQTKEDATIVDLFGETDFGMMRCLVAEVAALVRKRDVIALSVLVNESHRFLSVFTELGFRVRNYFPVMIIPSTAFPGKFDPQLRDWYLMQGDRDW